MDVLQYWSPVIDWSKFEQGTLSYGAWELFKDLVKLAHAHGHWVKAAQEISLSPPRQMEFPSETKQQFRKRQDAWKRDIERASGHMHRSEYLAAERIAILSYRVSPEDEGKPDWILYVALKLAVRHQPDHTQGRYGAVAFGSFDAGAEIEGDPAVIAMRWLRNAKLAEAAY